MRHLKVHQSGDWCASREPIQLVLSRRPELIGAIWIGNDAASHLANPGNSMVSSFIIRSVVEHHSPGKKLSIFTIGIAG